jgi:endoglucanase
MSHFTKDNSMNIFRLPVGWQYLVNNQLGGTLDSNNLGKYDQLVRACLSTGATCIIDVSSQHPDSCTEMRPITDQIYDFVDS